MGSMKSDGYIVTQRRDNLGNLIYGPAIWSVVNARTGEEITRVEGFPAAVAAIPVLVPDIVRRLAL